MAFNSSCLDVICENANLLHIKTSGTLRHSCADGIDCPLKQKVENLVKVATVIQGRVLGLCLDCLRKDRLFSSNELFAS